MRLLIIILFFPFSLSAQNVVDSLVVKHEQIIYFDSNSHLLGDNEKFLIKNLVDISNQGSSYKFFVDAHTDDVGSLEFNLKLSENRKKSVLAVLKEYSIPDSVIISNYHGESAPITVNVDDDSRQQNRRVVIQLLASIPFIELRGIVQDEETGRGIFTEVIISSKDFTTKAHTNQEGFFLAMAPLGTNVLIEATAKDYFISSKIIKTSRALVDKLIQLPLPQASMGKSFEFKDMLFVGNRAKLLPKSKPSLSQLQRFMFVNADVCIEIAGHVNHPGMPPVNLSSFESKLSIARANSIQDSLVMKGINPDRILSKGYGNWEMIYPKANNDKQRERNRRVEIIISSCDSTAIIQDDSFEGGLYSDESISKDNTLRALENFYNPQTIAADLDKTNDKIKRDISLQLKQMAKARMDATLYTYKELLMAFPDLPLDK